MFARCVDACTVRSLDNRTAGAIFIYHSSFETSSSFIISPFFVLRSMQNVSPRENPTSQPKHISAIVPRFKFRSKEKEKKNSLLHNLHSSDLPLPFRIQLPLHDPHHLVSQLDGPTHAHHHARIPLVLLALLRRSRQGDRRRDRRRKDVSETRPAGLDAEIRVRMEREGVERRVQRVVGMRWSRMMRVL